jgi:hypothetical protein
MFLSWNLKMISRILLLSTGFSAIAHATPIVVAVEDGSSTGTGVALVAQLNDDTYYDFTATLVTASDIDTAAELAAYDVVMFGASGNGYTDHDWTTTMATAVEAWVSSGGGNSRHWMVQLQHQQLKHRSVDGRPCSHRRISFWLQLLLCEQFLPWLQL